MTTKYTLALLLGLVAAGASAQTSKREMFADLDRTGSTYFAYPGPTQKVLTPAPAGYEPFYISHYGRHGSRYMTSNKYYVQAITPIDSAAKLGLLTPKGEEVLEKLKIGYADAYQRDGELTQLGARQHRGIARRMYERFPELLGQPLKVDARSSTSGRCMISMFNFCWELQGENPDLEITMAASEHDMPFVVSDSKVKPEVTPEAEAIHRKYSDYRDGTYKSDRLMKVLFKDVKKVAGFVDGPDLMKSLYNVAQDFQSLPELGLSMTDIFTKEELFHIWTGSNASWLRQSGIVPGSTPMYLQKKAVRDTMESIADRVIREGKPSLTLRFSHDSSVLPLAYLIGLKETQGLPATAMYAGRNDPANVYKYVSIDKIIPMAGNIQLVFYRKEGSDDVLVKFLLNENETSIPVKTDCAPYYHWSDVKRFWAEHPANK
jgi:hypothetical protein